MHQNVQWMWCFPGQKKRRKISGYLSPPLPSLHKHHTWLRELWLCFDFLSGLELPNIWLASLDAFFFLSRPSKVRLKPFSLGTEHYMIRKCLVERHDSERSKVQLYSCCLLLPSPLSLPSAVWTRLSPALQGLHSLEKITSPKQSGFSWEHMAFRFSVAQVTVLRRSILPAP